MCLNVEKAGIIEGKTHNKLVGSFEDYFQRGIKEMDWRVNQLTDSVAFELC